MKITYQHRLIFGGFLHSDKSPVKNKNSNQEISPKLNLQ